jgi:hypothetical protein
MYVASREVMVRMVRSPGPEWAVRGRLPQHGTKARSGAGRVAVPARVDGDHERGHLGVAAERHQPTQSRSGEVS